MAEAPSYRPTPAEALRIACIGMAAESVGTTGGDLIEAATAIHDFIKGRRRKISHPAPPPPGKVLPWPKAPHAS